MNDNGKALIVNSLAVWQERSSLFVSMIDPQLTPGERRSSIKETLSQVGKLDDTLNLVWSELLYEVRELEYYKDWGFEKFGEYADQELGLEKQKANALASIYEVYVVDCMIPADICHRLQFTKAFICKAYLKKNPDQWEDVVEAMDTMNCARLRDWISAKMGKEVSVKNSVTLKFEDADSLALWEQCREWVSENVGQSEVSNAYTATVLCQEYLSSRLDAQPGTRDFVGSVTRAIEILEKAYGVRVGSVTAAVSNDRFEDFKDDDVREVVDAGEASHATVS